MSISISVRDVSPKLRELVFRLGRRELGVEYDGLGTAQLVDDGAQVLCAPQQAVCEAPGLTRYWLGVRFGGRTVLVQFWLGQQYADGPLRIVALRFSNGFSGAEWSFQRVLHGDELKEHTPMAHRGTETWIEGGGFYVVDPDGSGRLPRNAESYDGVACYRFEGPLGMPEAWAKLMEGRAEEFRCRADNFSKLFEIGQCDHWDGEWSESLED